MKYILILGFIFLGCTNDDMKKENKELREQVKTLTKFVKQQEDEIEYLGHQLMDCKKK